MATPSMIPPLNLSLGSGAKSGDAGGSASGQGMGALTQGDWIIQRTGTGNNAATPLPDIGKNGLLMAAIGAAAAWFLLRR